MAEYQFPIEIDVGKSIADVGQVIESVNSTLSTFGVSERLRVGAQIGAMTITVGRVLSTEEEASVRRILEEGFTARFPDFGITVGNPRRQTGKSSNQSIARQ